MINWIKKHSPIEVYVLTGLLSFVLFGSPALAFGNWLLRPDVVFRGDFSIVSRFIQAVAGPDMYPDAVTLLYWTLLISFVGLMTLKARKISAWLWDR